MNDALIKLNHSPVGEAMDPLTYRITLAQAPGGTLFAYTAPGKPMPDMDRRTNTPIAPVQHTLFATAHCLRGFMVMSVGLSQLAWVKVSDTANWAAGEPCICGTPLYQHNHTGQPIDLMQWGKL